MENLTPLGKIITGYKATDANMCCRGFQFELGKWYEHDGKLSLCESGFHFCEYPSGPWAYYSDMGTRTFKCEAELVLLQSGPGADLKHIAKKIRLVEEIKFYGHMNTGHMNTGHMNTGDGNTGHMNTGDRNTGDRNTGHRNTGDRNTGHRNTGDMNTGDRNTGHRNTGDRNTGHRNTGDGNAGNSHPGYFNIGDAPFIVFGKKCDRENFDFELAEELSKKLSSDDDFDPSPFLSITNSTAKKIKQLHSEHIRLRAEKRK